MEEFFLADHVPTPHPGKPPFNRIVEEFKDVIEGF
jgi:hypothetical protein